MLEPRGEADLPEEALGPERARELRVEDLEGDGPVVPEVAGEVHRGHAAAPELALDDVAVTQRVDEWRWRLGHRGTGGEKIVRICGRWAGLARPGGGQARPGLGDGVSRCPSASGHCAGCLQRLECPEHTSHHHARASLANSAVMPGGPMGTMRLVLDTCGRGLPVEVGVDRLGSSSRPDNRVWLDIRDPGPAEVELLRDVFGFHELALKDVTGRTNGPGATPTGLLLHRGLCRRAGGRGDRAARAQPVLGQELLGDDPSRGQRGARRADGSAPTVGPSRAAAGARDRVPGLRAVREPGGRLLRGAGSGAGADRGHRGGDPHGRRRPAADLFRLRKELLRVPRLLAPTSHVLAEVLRRERTIPESLRPYFADVQDHAVHVLASSIPIATCWARPSTCTSSRRSTGSVTSCSD